MQFIPKASHLFILVPLIALIAVFFTPATTFAHAASGGPNRHLRTAAVTSLCPDCQGKDPYTYLHNGAPCSDSVDWNAVFSTDIPGGRVTVYYSVACGTNWADVADFNPLLIANANIQRADGLRLDGTWIPWNTPPNIYGVWSPMVYAPFLRARACGSINNMPGGCTIWI